MVGGPARLSSSCVPVTICQRQDSVEARRKPVGTPSHHPASTARNLHLRISSFTTSLLVISCSAVHIYI
jgi:hypothetical protein